MAVLRSSNRRRVRFDECKAQLQGVADEIERRHPSVRALLHGNSITNISLSIGPRNHEGYAILLFGVEELDGKVLLSGRPVSSPERFQELLGRFWTVDSYLNTITEMATLNESPAKGRIFRCLANALAKSLPFDFEISPTDVARFAASAGEATLAGVEVVLCPRGNPAETSAAILPGDRAIFAGHWIKVLDAKFTAPGRWTLDCVKTPNRHLPPGGHNSPCRVNAAICGTL